MYVLHSFPTPSLFQVQSLRYLPLLLLAAAAYTHWSIINLLFVAPKGLFGDELAMLSS